MMDNFSKTTKIVNPKYANHTIYYIRTFLGIT